MKNLTKTIFAALFAFTATFTMQQAHAQYPNYGNYGNDGYYNNGYGNDYYDDDYGQYGYHNDGYTDYQMFYNELAPYGNWMHDPNYGYVWMPRVGRDFRPYFSNGNWMMTNMGNMWMSDYRWGWIPFHYGRWVFNDFYGWLWIPGRQWAPAWVVWRQGGGHYGWSAMGPSINININIGGGGYYDNIPHSWWNFIPMGNLYGGNYGRYRYGNVNNYFINNTTIINNYDNYDNNRFFAGPRATDVRRVTGRDVPVYNVNNVNSRTGAGVSGRSVNVYTPRIERSKSRTTAITPRSYERINSNRATQVERVTNSGRKVDVKDNRGNTSVPNRSVERKVNDNNSRTIESQQPQDRRINNAPSRTVQPVPNRSNNNNSIQRQAAPNNRTVAPVERRIQQPATPNNRTIQENNRTPQRSIQNTTPQRSIQSQPSNRSSSMERSSTPAQRSGTVTSPSRSSNSRSVAPAPSRNSSSREVKSRR